VSRPAFHVVNRQALLVDPVLAPVLARAVGLLRDQWRRDGLLWPRELEELEDVLAAVSAGFVDAVSATTAEEVSSEVSPVDDLGFGAVESVTVTTAAEILDVSRQRVRTLCRDGRLAAVEVSGQWRIDPVSLAAYQEARACR
jgi:excisionase family DNA binding protein